MFNKAKNSESWKNASNWNKFKYYNHEICGMKFDKMENFVVCAECQEPIYKEDFDNSKPVCPCCCYNIETEEIEIEE